MRCNLLFYMVFFLIYLPAGRSVAAEITIASSSSSPPYIIPEQDRGIAVDLLRAIFAPAGVKVRFLYAPNLRLEHELERGRVDGVYAVPASGVQNSFLTSPLLEYSNVAVTLKQNRIALPDVTSLKRYRIATFQNATRFLGPEFAFAAERSPDYIEVSNQHSQVAMLYNHRVDVIVLERRIFEYFNLQLQREGRQQEVDVHPLFQPAGRHAAFRTEALSKQFEAGLAALKASGAYQRIIDNYLHSPAASMAVEAE